MVLNLKLKPAIYLFIGKPASGKSYALKSLMFDFQKAKYFKFILAFVRTKFNHGYDWLPDEYVDDKYSDQKLLTHIEKLRAYRKKSGKECPPNALIFDDLLGTVDWYSDQMSNFLCSYRHTNTSIFLTSQYLMSKTTSTALREMVNYAFLWNSKFQNSLKAYYEAFGTLYSDKKEFFEDFQRITSEKYTCMVYDANEDDKELNYIPFKFPEHVPEFTLKYKIS
jgi:hypothetical protein